MPRGSDTALRLSYALKPSAPKDVQKRALSEIEAALRLHGGHISETASYLGIGRVTLHRWFVEYPRLAKALDVAKRAGPHPGGRA